MLLCLDHVKADMLRASHLLSWSPAWDAGSTGSLTKRTYACSDTTVSIWSDLLCMGRADAAPPSNLHPLGADRGSAGIFGRPRPVASQTAGMLKYCLLCCGSEEEAGCLSAVSGHDPLSAAPSGFLP